MAAIKKFFEKKKLDVKFKKAGSGHTLSDSSVNRTAPATHRSNYPYPDRGVAEAQRFMPSREAQRAGEAALQRISQPKTAGSKVTTELQEAKRAVRAEMDSERESLEKLQISSSTGPSLVQLDAVPMVPAVLFHCPDVGPAILSKDEMDLYIREFLVSQLEEEAEMTSAVMIQTLNTDREKIRVCVETVSKYLENLIANPGDEKYRKIRVGNKTFQERVASLAGTDEFLRAVGFEKKVLDIDGSDIEFLWLDEARSLETERLVSVREILLAAEPIRAQISRSATVFHPSKRAEKFAIPPEFYNVSPEEIKREQQIRQEAIEKMGMLRTKAMRERDEIKELRRYRYALIRVRFPDGLLLQGTFRANERLPALFDFVRDSLENDWVPFNLSTMIGQKLSGESTRTIAEEGLAPSVILNFNWDESVMADMSRECGVSVTRYLKPELMKCIRSL